ncbi:MAG TPA: helix-turn-helix domain-containing protein [Pseudonocardiaceae bacterium]
MADTQDPRFVRSRESMLTAARELLQDEGPAAVTHQRVAQRAGVGRATVYRHWSHPGDLLQDAMSAADVPFFRQPRLPLRPWLLAELRRIADELALPALASIAVTLMYQARWQTTATSYRDHQLQLLDHRLQAAFALAADAGELDEPLQPPVLTAILLGPLIFRTTLQEGTVPDVMLERLIDAAAKWR